jgi:hypothetical protein
VPSKAVHYEPLIATIRFTNASSATLPPAFAPPPPSAHPALTPDQAYTRYGAPTFHVTDPQGPDVITLGVMSFQQEKLTVGPAIGPERPVQHELAWGYARLYSCGGFHQVTATTFSHVPPYPCTDWLILNANTGRKIADGLYSLGWPEGMGRIP